MEGEALGFLGTVLFDKGVEKGTNQIKFDNFTVQASEKKIMKFKQTCPKTSDLGDAIYMNLYDYLIKKEIITSNIKGLSALTFDTINNINQDKLKTLDGFKGILSDFSTIFPCYDIDMAGLFKFLKEYKYNASDEAKYLDIIKQEDFYNK